MDWLQSRVVTGAVTLISAVSFGIILKDGSRDAWHWFGLIAFGGMAIDVRP
jgi:hypothetical protein